MFICIFMHFYACLYVFYMHELELSTDAKPCNNLEDTPESSEVPSGPEHHQPIRMPQEASHCQNASAFLLLVRQVNACFVLRRRHPRKISQKTTKPQGRQKHGSWVWVVGWLVSGDVCLEGWSETPSGPEHHQPIRIPEEACQCQHASAFLLLVRQVNACFVHECIARSDEDTQA